MKQNETYHGFTVKRIRPINELNAQFIEMTHDKTGLELVWLSREEENKTFSVTFETLPWNDTGVFHILEHSVLCGSDKYQVKEPFVELLKNSINTFLNAMTFPDKTMYPVSSRNPKDFVNLMRVYLDAVFHPLIYSKPEIFYQEGWHYEFDENGKPSYKGVVFNEMKGAFADADQLMMDAVNRAIFPDSPYRYVSGGDPASIPDLDYEQFIDSHRRFYSPSNAYIFLDGSMDIDNILSIINDEYLSDFERSERMAPPVPQKPVDGKEVEVMFELGEGEDPSNKTRICWGSVVGNFDEREKCEAMQILSTVLAGSNQSPLNKAILSKGLAEDVEFWMYDGVSQPWVALTLKNLKPENKEEAEKTLFDELRRLSEEGIDREQLEAVMANLEFKMRERDYDRMPQGLVINMTVMESWLYGGDPAANIEVGDLFVNLRRKMNEGYFEQLIKDVLLNNPHSCKIVMTPSATAGEERRKLEADRLAAEESAWSSDDRQKLVKAQEKLDAWQKSSDSEEDLRSLPTLTLDDISREPEVIPTEISEQSGIKILKHDVNTNGIVYYNLYFDADDLDEEQLSHLTFLCTLFRELRTENYTEEQLVNKARLLCGSISFRVVPYSGIAGADDVRVKLNVSFSTLKDNSMKALEFVCGILTKTLFDDETVALNLIRQAKTQMFQSIIMSGSSYAIGRASAYFSTNGVAVESTRGLKYYRWICANESGWDWNKLRPELESLSKEIVSKRRLTVSMTGADEDCIARSISYLNENISEGSKVSGELKLVPWGKRYEGIAIPADIGFAAMGSNLGIYGQSFTGEIELAAKIIHLAYLWNVIRVQGGAYGAGMPIGYNGSIFCYSYRDPNAAGSIDSYRKCGEFLRSFMASKPDLTGFIIGSVADSSPLLTPKLKGSTADSDYWRGITIDDKRSMLESKLSATPESLCALADVIEKSICEGGICVFAARNQLDKCPEIVDIESL